MRLDLQLANTRDAFELARQDVLSFLEPCGLAPKTAFAVELVLEETLMNLAWHAFQDAAAHRIELGVAVHDDHVELAFTDDGVPFDPTQAADPVAPRSLAEARPGGLGLMLVRKMARSVRYQRDGGRNLLRVEVARA